MYSTTLVKSPQMVTVTLPLDLQVAIKLMSIQQKEDPNRCDRVLLGRDLDTFQYDMWNNIWL